MKRAIFYTPKYKDELLSIREKYGRANDIQSAVVWQLQKRPEKGTKLVSDDTHRVMGIGPIGAFPPFRILYYYDPKTDPGKIILKSIEEVNIDAEEAGI